MNIDANMIEYIADRLAEGDNIKQGKFLNRFFDRMTQLCDNGQRSESQLCFMADSLSHSTLKCMESIVEFGKLKSQQEGGSNDA